MRTSPDAKEYIREFKKRGLSIYRLAGMSVDELKQYMKIEDSLAEKIILEARLEVEKNMMRKKSKYHDELIMLPYIGVKRAEILHSKNLKIEDIAKMKPKELLAILPGMMRREAEDAIISAEIIVEERGERKEEKTIKKEEIKQKPIKNQIIKVKYPGLVNGNGLINGRGLINGLSFGRRKKERVKFPILLIVLAIILLPVAMYFLFVPVSGILIDGHFDDWKNIKGIEDTRGDSSPDIYLIKIKEYSSIYIYAKFSEPLFVQPEILFIFIDGDNNPSTGYSIGNKGADYCAEILGWDNMIKGKKLLFYNSTSQYDWNAWIYHSSIHAAFYKQQIEMKIPINGKNSTIEIYARNSKGSMDFLDFPIDPLGRGITVKMDYSQTKPDVVANVYINSTVRCNLTVQFEIFGNTKNMRISPAIYLDNGNNILDNSDKIISNGYAVTLNTKKSHLFAVLNITGSGDVGLRVSRVKANYPVRIINNIYAIPFGERGIKIDGYFNDWKNVTKNEDNYQDIGNSKLIHENIDIEETARKGENFYIKTYAPILAGDLIPTLIHKIMPDSDRDGVPDEFDPMPYDFNNDGIEDKDTNHDVDGDGIPDYPYGNDYWLNTTIPSNFPKPYAGREVHRYIGPIPKIPLTGNDTFLIFIKSENGSYKAPFLPFSSDYVVRITGKGFKAKGELLHYEGFWKRVRKINFAFFGRELEGNSTISGNIFVVSTDWIGQRDFSPELTRDGKIEIQKTQNSSEYGILGADAVYRDRILYWNGIMSFDNLTLINCTVIVNGTLELDVRFNFYMDVNTTITANGTGYSGGKGGNSSFLNGTNGSGLGYGEGGANSGGGGGGAYGGYGGSGGGDNGSGGSPYGTDNGTDIDIGSGGGGGAARITNGGVVLNGGDGGNGGGCIKIYGENITIDGNIYADGNNGKSALGGGGGGGSGGGVLIYGSNITLNGNLSVRGGDGGISLSGGGGGGSGGRIKIFYRYNVTVNGSLNVSGGIGGIGSSSGQNGDNGTIIIKRIPEFRIYSFALFFPIFIAINMIRRRRKN